MDPCIVTPEQHPLDLDFLNHKFDSAHPKSILTWCLDNIPEGLVQSTAFGASGMVILDFLYQDLNPEPAIPVLFLDTLHHFPETLQLAEDAKAHYDLDLHIFRPQGIDSRTAFAEKYGDQLWEHDIEQFHQLTKVEPLQQGLHTLNVTSWITGRRRDQASSRAKMPIFELDLQGRLKINPLANWTYKAVWSYLVSHQVLYNPLYDQGYASIGDEPLTTTTKTGEEERAGRWRGTARVECGMHV
ncbi:phosphoadenosine phosphosulfate reductase [Acaryochloris sp. IP29b_bin.148]|uniref:phosphoadenosine phosphosulfate reductase n=1 Tax=Acaryochloris sp. IP29b_bin.148 TaxID=2969218 RepID=UPI00263693D1|nr:phosphoadenosine phosphosulfate reductase [Acaryochloris sp. IP29b_bin.148]